MKPVKLAGLQPETLFGYFEKLCSIPHGSGNTKALSDYFLEFAAEHSLKSIRDEAGNVILFKKASAGYEDHPPVILQAHMDMVCQKKADCTLDMEKDPLDVTHDGTFVFASGTSLGADDGAGVALCLTLLSDDTLAHPPLEIVFTNDEEIGLLGANKMDLSMLKGRRLINLDGAHESYVIAGCAGGARVTLELPLEKSPCEGIAVTIRLDGLRGGHSGGLIHLPYANANKAMVQLLKKLAEVAPFRIAAFNGGTAGNAIPKSCEAKLIVAADAVETIKQLSAEHLVQLKDTYDEPDAVLCVEAAEATEAYTADSTKAIIGLLDELPNAMLEYFEEFKIAKTSLNLGIVKTGDTLWLQTNIRSNVNQSRQDLQDRVRAVGDKYGCVYDETGIYPAWEYLPESTLRDTMVRVSRQIRGIDPAIKVTHAGLECGLFGEKLPGLDCVSAGTNMRYIHTADEKLEIEPFGRTLEFLKNVLKEL